MREPRQRARPIATDAAARRHGRCGALRLAPTPGAGAARLEGGVRPRNRRRRSAGGARRQDVPRRRRRHRPAAHDARARCRRRARCSPTGSRSAACTDCCSRAASRRSSTASRTGSCRSHPGSSPPRSSSLIAHLGGGCQWTFSTYGLQVVTPDALRGRIFAADFALGHGVDEHVARARGVDVERTSASVRRSSASRASRSRGACSTSGSRRRSARPTSRWSRLQRSRISVAARASLRASRLRR